MNKFCFLIFETVSTCRARFPYLYPSTTGWQSYTPEQCVSFPSPLKIHVIGSAPPNVVFARTAQRAPLLNFLPQLPAYDECRLLKCDIVLALVTTDVSEERITSFIRMLSITELIT
jgi:hypothetical protein